MSPWLFNVYTDAVMKEVKIGMGVRFPGFLCTDDLILCGESEEGLRAMVGRFVEVCRRRELKFNAGKRKIIVLNGEERMECEVQVDGIRLEHVSEFKYLGCGFGRIRYRWGRM